MLPITIDQRETELLRHVAEARVETLPLGDIRVGDILLERKTGADFAASIKDGRWRNQKARMLECSLTCMYIIEGPLKNHSIPYKTLLSAMGNTVLRDGMHIWRTQDIRETTRIILMLANKVGTASTSTLMPPRMKREHDEEHIYERMLMCVPGVSERIARSVKGKYPTLRTLRRALRRNLKDVERIRPHKKRCVGPRLAKKIYDAFYK